MFYVDHGTLLDGKIFDAKIYQYVSCNDTLSTLKMSIEDSEWMRDSCHPNGYFRCNRCYRKHFIINNFELIIKIKKLRILDFLERAKQS